MPANFMILTNNPLARDKYPDVSQLREDGVEGIFVAARDLIHRGARLINHPLSGSIKPNESPYKSLVLSTKTQGLDMESLQLIEGAMAVLKKLAVKNRPYGPQVMEDFRVIDLDLLDSAIKALPVPYHF